MNRLLLAGLLSFVLSGLSNAQEKIVPKQYTWQYLAAIKDSTSFHREVKDGNILQRLDEKERLQNLPLPANTKIIRYVSPPTSGIQLMSGNSPEPFAQFEGLGDGQPRGIATIPPDTYGAVGDDEVVSVTNSEIVVRNKATGFVSGPIAGLDAFFSGVQLGGQGVDPYDPRVVYDHVANRYIIVVCLNGGDVVNNGFAIAVSQTGNPLGAWSFYVLDTDGSNTTWFDFPYVALNKNWIYVSGSMFNDDDNYQNSKAYVFEKNALYNGTPITLNVNAKEIAFTQSEGINFCGVMDYDQTSDSLYTIQQWSSNQNGSSFLRLGTITGTMPNISFSNIAFIEKAGFTYSPNAGSVDFAQQSGSNRNVNTGDTRMGNAMRRGNQIWCTHTVFLPQGAPTYCAPEWFQIGLTGNILQTGVVGNTPGQFRYYPSIAANSVGDVLLGYSVSNSNIFVSSAYSTRVATDAINTMKTEFLYREGAAFYVKTFGGTRNRWGDYSNTLLDPINQSLWTVQEYAASPLLQSGQLVSQWGTWWANVASSQPLGPLPVDLIAFDAMPVGNHVNVDWTVAQEKDIRGYQVQRSKDGIAFESIGTVNAFNSDKQQVYQFVDERPLLGKSYYRLKVMENSGSNWTSKVVSIVISQSHPVLLSTTPNPFQSQFQLKWYAPGSDNYTVSVINTLGQVLHQTTADVQEGYYIHEVNGSNWTPGTYTFRIVSRNGWVQTGRIIKQ